MSGLPASSASGPPRLPRLTSHPSLWCPLLVLAVGLAAAPPAGAQPRPFTVVVLGSSNAEGQGPEHRDSTWVNRLRARWSQEHPGIRVLNYAKGGYTTTNVLPTGARMPERLPQPDPLRNVTHAVALGADAIVVSLTSNDSWWEIPVADQLANYDATCRAAGPVPVWFTTTTPRSDASERGRQLQPVVRDSTTARYSARSIDFWTGVGAEDGTAAPGMGAGDGIHFSDAAHRLFFERVEGSTLGVLVKERPGGNGRRRR